MSIKSLVKACQNITQIINTLHVQKNTLRRRTTNGNYKNVKETKQNIRLEKGHCVFKDSATMNTDAEFVKIPLERTMKTMNIAKIT